MRAQQTAQQTALLHAVPIDPTRTRGHTHSLVTQRGDCKHTIRGRLKLLDRLPGRRHEKAP